MKTVSGNKSFIETLGEREEPTALPPEHYSKVALELPSWCSAYPWGAGALGRGGQEWGTVLSSSYLSCLWSSLTSVKNVCFSHIFGCKILSQFSSRSESESCKLLDLGRFSVQLNTTGLCISDKYSLSSWASLCFYNLSAHMIFIRMCSISKRFLVEWSVLATVLISWSFSYLWENSILQVPVTMICMQHRRLQVNYCSSTHKPALTHKPSLPHKPSRAWAWKWEWSLSVLSDSWRSLGL